MLKFPEKPENVFLLSGFFSSLKFGFVSYMQMPWENQSTCVAPKMNIALVRGWRGKNHNGKHKERQQQ